ncbi:MAG: response regulator transcription factor [Candidatus Dormibacteraeota bacterium]|uniref:Response regulator transcription factor n=1 Tax=Candidatus Amunia macphersoniae TaxID=3127014 RepID=A0A934KN84_9BACT|nr:response regulator transcription factor [Candidatus Dormibacteraeota bacterium]
MSRAIRLLIVDDHPMVRRGLTELFEGEEDIEVVAAAADGEEAIATAAAAAPDVVLMDISMPGMSGIEAARRVLDACPETNVVMLTSFHDHEKVIESLDSGAVGYLLKEADSEELLRGVRAAAAGDSPLSAKAARAVLSARHERSPIDDLTGRELDVLRLVGRGLANKQVAWRLGISEKTVKAHMTSIFHRLGVADRTQAALWAQRHDLL